MAKATITIQDVDDENIEIIGDFDPPIDGLGDDELPFTHFVAGYAARFIAQLLSDEDETLDNLPLSEPGPAFSVEIPLQEAD
jgi:hypothetical protein